MTIFTGGGGISAAQLAGGTLPASVTTLSTSGLTTLNQVFSGDNAVHLPAKIVSIPAINPTSIGWGTGILFGGYTSNNAAANIGSIALEMTNVTSGAHTADLVIKLPVAGVLTEKFRFKSDGTTDPTFGGGSGDVVGPSSSTDNALARFDSTTGKLIQNSDATLADDGTITATEFVGGGAGITGVTATAVPGLPAWTYTAGAMASGKFTTDNASPASTTELNLSIEIKNGNQSLESRLATIPIYSVLLLTDATGESIAFQITSDPVPNGTHVTFSVSTATNETSWSGDYQLSVWLNTASFASIIAIDSGWTANASAGDKTVVVSDYSGSGIDGTMEGALNLVSAGLGTALVQDEARIRELIKKLQAHETALAARLLPNA